MAARNPSSFNLAIDQSGVRPRKYIYTTVPDATLDNQERLVTMPRVVLVDLWSATQTSDAVSLQRLAGTYFFRGRDTMGTGTITTARAYVLCRGANAGENLAIQVAVSGTNYNLTVSSSQTTWLWREVSAAVTLASDETEEYLDLNCRVFDVGNTVAAAGLVLTTV